MELAEAAYRLALGFAPAVRADGRSRRRGRALAGRVLIAWGAFLESVTWAAIELGEVAERVPELMYRYGLGSYDAVHAATWELTGAEALVAKDAHFGNLPESFGWLYVDSSRLRSCRLRRARARR